MGETWRGRRQLKLAVPFAKLGGLRFAARAVLAINPA